MNNIAVVIPAYKVENYIERCIDSVINQTIHNYDIIIIDDGSPDSCGEYCDQYAIQYDYIHVIHQVNGGLSAARNSGIDYSFLYEEYQWITFIDSDDWVCSEYIEYLFRAVKDNKCLISVCYALFSESSTIEKQSFNYGTRELSPEQYWVEREGYCGVAWEKLFCKNLWLNIRFPVGKLYEDDFTTYKVLFACNQIAVLDCELYIYFYSPSSIMRSTWSKEKFVHADAMMEQTLYFKKNGYRKAEKIAFEIMLSVIINDYAIIQSEFEKYGYYEDVLIRKITEFTKKYYAKLSMWNVLHNPRIFILWYGFSKKVRAAVQCRINHFSKVEKRRN